MKNPARLEDVPDIASQACHPQGYGELISMGADEDSYFYHYDGLGSTDRVTGADESVVNQYLYRAFGEQTDVIEEGITNRFTWGRTIP